MLRAGGNAVDAAVAAVLMSFVAESPLTGPGAGGFMVVHTGGESHVLDFFVAAPGLGLDGREPAALVPIDVASRRRGPALQCGPCVMRRLWHHAWAGRDARALRHRARSPTSRPRPPGPRARASRSFRCRRSCSRSCVRSSRSTPECAAIYAPEGRLLAEGDTSGCRSWATCSTGSARRARLPLQRRRGRGGERLGARARRHAQPRGPRLVRGDRARAGARDLRGAR